MLQKGPLDSDSDAPAGAPRVIVFSSLFPSQAAPTSGTFIRERMFRVGRFVPLIVVAPQAWSPVDPFIRWFRRTFRPMAPAHEVMDGVEVYRPRFFSLPGVLKGLDGLSMAYASLRCVRRIQEKFRPTLIDAHFLYPDGYAATRIGRALGLPVTITIRGSKDEWLIGTNREPMLREAMNAAAHLFSVSESLKRDVGVRMGVEPSKITVVGNGVDLDKFARVDQHQARKRVGLPDDAQVMIGVGGLIERKGFHRVIPLISELREKYPNLIYVIVGGGATQADMSQQLVELCRLHGVADMVRLVGPKPPEELKWYYSAADIFVLATAHEGWANVFLEAMACGLPVVTTRVGGNPQVVADGSLGSLVDYWDPISFRHAIDQALSTSWDRDRIIAYARLNTWDDRVGKLVAKFRELCS